MKAALSSLTTAALAIALLPAPAQGASRTTAGEVVARYLEARGGADRWRALAALELRGTYSAFSFHEPFRLIRKRGDLYRLDYLVLGSPAVRARDASGPWGLDPLLWPQAAHVTEEPYRGQLERESMFEPPLVDHQEKGIAVELIGEGDVEGEPTVDLRLTFPGGREELWHLDAESGLEVAIDGEVFDFTQGTAPMRRRTFFDDFREVEGLVIPFQVEHEFGARLEAMTVREVRIDPELDDSAFAAPPAPKAEAEAAEPAAGGDP